MSKTSARQGCTFEEVLEPQLFSKGELRMDVLFLLVPLALGLAGLGVWAFIWAVRRGQFDDVHTPAMRILVDDEVDEEAADS